MPVSMQQLPNGNTQFDFSFNERRIIVTLPVRGHRISQKKESILTYFLFYLHNRYGTTAALMTNSAEHRNELMQLREFFRTPESRDFGCCSASHEIRYRFARCTCNHSRATHHSNLLCQEFQNFYRLYSIRQTNSLVHALKVICDTSIFHSHITQSAQIALQYIESLNYSTAQPSTPHVISPVVSPVIPIGRTNEFTNLRSLILQKSSDEATLISLSEFKEFLVQPLQQFNTDLDIACRAGTAHPVPIVMGVNLTQDPESKDSISYLYDCLQEFIYDFQRQGYCRENWTGVMRDFHRDYRNHKNRAFAFDPSTGKGNSSFLIFTREHYPGHFFVLLKPNTFLTLESHFTDYKGQLWESGSKKQIKLFGLLFTCHWHENNIVTLQSIKRIVTFTTPTPNTYELLKKHFEKDPEMSARLATHTSKANQKAIIMDALLHASTAKFDFGYGDWTILSYLDSRIVAPQSQNTTTHARRLLAFQEFQGALITLDHLKSLTYDQKTYATLMLLNKLKEITLLYKTWARDIKINNTVISIASLVAEKKYPAFVPIDWSSSTCTFSNEIPLPNPQEQGKRSGIYHFAYWKHAVHQLETNGNINQLEFTKIAHQFCFEIVHTLYFLFNHKLNRDSRIVHAFVMSNNLSERIDRGNFESSIQAIYRKIPITQLPFHQLLMSFTYEYHSQIAHLSILDLFMHLFLSIRNELCRITSMDRAIVERNAAKIPFLTEEETIPNRFVKFDIPEISIEVINAWLNDAWISEFLNEFLALPTYRRAHPLSDPQIEELNPLY